jgi:hypothetical protein
VKLSSRALRYFGIPLLILGLVAATAIDADGDITTVNLPSVVLVASEGIPAVDESQTESSRSDVPSSEKISAALCRHLHRLVESVGITGRLHHAVRSIRGP